MKCRLPAIPFIILIAVTTCGVSAQPTVPSRSNGPSRDADAVISALEARLKKEIAENPDHPWAGSYYRGIAPGGYFRLTLAPSGQFLFRLGGCVGDYARVHGTVSKVSEGTLKFNPAKDLDREMVSEFVSEFVVITWGDRRYLVPTGQIAGFCDSEGGAAEPRGEMDGNYYLRWGDNEKPAHGVPLLPKKYGSYAATISIKAEIVSTGETTAGPGLLGTMQRSIVTFDAGRDKEVLPGYWFILTEPVDILAVGTVTSVNEKTSTATIEWHMGKNGKSIRPAIGWKFATTKIQYRSR